MTTGHGADFKITPFMAETGDFSLIHGDVKHPVY